jgi:hypothetical protein
MTQVWAQTAMWLGLALATTLLSIGLKVATGLSEIAIGSAVVPTLIANAFHLPRHLLPQDEAAAEPHSIAARAGPDQHG